MIRLDFPLPETPDIQQNNPSGKSKLIFLVNYFTNWIFAQKINN